MIEISNYYERLVIDQLWKIAQDPEQALNQGDLEDIACLVLNNLPPCYVRSLIDKASYITDTQYQEMCAKVTQAISVALAQVRIRPHNVRE